MEATETADAETKPVACTVFQPVSCGRHARNGVLHPESPTVAPDMMLSIYEVDATSIQSLDLSDLPAEWDQFPCPACTHPLSPDFLGKPENAGLFIPRDQFVSRHAIR